MANQTGIKMLLDKLKLQLETFQQAFKVRAALQNKQHPLRQRISSTKGEYRPVYTGPQLEIGNELLITDDIVRTYRGLSNSLGRVVIIDHISVTDDETIKASAFGIQVYVDTRVAGQMREAYLRREQTPLSVIAPTE
jgi:hypothetical protein